MTNWTINQIIHGDVLESLKQIPSGCAQLIIADPPYNLGPKFGNKKEWIKDGKWTEWSKEWLEECKRILSEDGNLFVYGIHHYLCYTQVALYELDMKYRRQIIWNYENGFSAARKTLATHYEPLLWFSKTDNYFYKEIREPYKSQERLKHKITKNGKEWLPNPAGRMAGDVWSFPTLSGRRFADEKVDHPTQKPLSISRRIVEHFSEKNKLVVVPFVGSGTECVAALELGRNYWGCEINEKFIEIANKRLSAALTL